MSVNGVKNLGGNQVGQTNGKNGGGPAGSDFQSTLKDLERVMTQQAQNSVLIRQVSAAMASLKEAGRAQG